MKIGVFGHGVPYGLLARIGLCVEDVTHKKHAVFPRAEPFIEPFMDPFAASFLHGLAGAQLSGFDAIVLLRESPGAVHAHQYGVEFERRGILPADAPRLILLNLVPSLSAAAQTFNLTELDRLQTLLGDRPVPHPRPELTDLVHAQAAGALSARAAFEWAFGAQADPGPRPAQSGPRLAVLGAPMGRAALHGLLDRAGSVVFDQQISDLACASGEDLETYCINPFAARQPRDLYVQTVAGILKRRRINRVIWQVDPADDLWGWLAPDVARIARTAGADFVDLGFLPRWPEPQDLVTAAARLGVEAPA